MNHHPVVGDNQPVASTDWSRQRANTLLPILRNHSETILGLTRFAHGNTPAIGGKLRHQYESHGTRSVDACGACKPASVGHTSSMVHPAPRPGHGMHRCIAVDLSLDPLASLSNGLRAPRRHQHRCRLDTPCEGNTAHNRCNPKRREEILPWTVSSPGRRAASYTCGAIQVSIMTDDRS